jgi:hypothetical protein
VKEKKNGNDNLVSFVNGRRRRAETQIRCRRQMLSHARCNPVSSLYIIYLLVFFFFVFISKDVNINELHAKCIGSVWSVRVTPADRMQISLTTLDKTTGVYCNAAKETKLKKKN